MSYASKISDKLSAQLPGPILAAAHVMPQGGLKATSKRAGAMAMGGIVGAVVATKVAEKQAKAMSDVGDILPVAAQMGLVLTDNALWTVENSAMTNGPKKVLGSLPLSEVVSIENGQGKHMGMKMAIITVQLRDGRSISFEVARAHLKESDALLEAATPLINKAA